MTTRILILTFIALIGSQAARADWDPELEAKATAERARQQQAQKMPDAAKAEPEVMDDKRKALGVAAQGKTDAEVDRLYQAQIRQNQQEAERLSAEARAVLSSGQGAAAVKQITGKTLQELENMSDAEAEALAQELEKKYGQ
ncbi:hypothetical protein [Methylomonas koyamae]|uniref:hypothetical protein n=1 Tax=Methylomonas koyamae TaxID=702114 RepID=UPI00112CADE6|nr:hypothetical protein [Methylomonas koyamae]TPQ28244.1 hypothetical protein C2U68_05550 [Methylomonas koyamae]